MPSGPKLNHMAIVQILFKTMYLPGQYPELIELLLEQYNTTSELLSEQLPEEASPSNYSQKIPLGRSPPLNQIGLVVDGFTSELG